MAGDQDNQETLREALLNLDRLREQERTARLKMETLVGGIHILNECQNVSDMYREVLVCLHGLLPFDSAAILVEQEEKGFLSTAMSSDSRLRFKSVPIAGLFERCLNGRPTNLTNLSLASDWPASHTTFKLEHDEPASKQPLRSALLLALPSSTKRMMLVCASETLGGFKRKDLALLRSFAPLATQAVRRAMEMERLNYLATTLDHQAHFDALTGLPNRALFEQKIDLFDSEATAFSILFVDLDNFKSINDTFGHAIGDILLSEIAFRMSSVVDPQDTVARMGGDEFALLIVSRSSSKDVSRLCEELLLSIRKPLFLRNSRIVPTASIGVLHAPETTLPGQQKMQRADIAMYSAKSVGRNGYCFFDDDMKSGVESDFEIESKLPLAIKTGAFHLVYQPIFDSKTMASDRAEVLVRWENFGKTLYSPVKFIPIAERTGNIIELGEWIVTRALEESRAWLASSANRVLSINVSQAELQRTGYAEQFIKLALDANVSCQQLELELSENIVADCDNETMLDNLHALTEKGVTLSLDDFGTGHSSLLHIKRFPCTCLKIDKSFVDDIASSHEQRRLVAGMIDFAHHVGMEVVAEGVESEEQLDILVELGADHLQGYLLARPNRAEATLSAMNAWNRTLSSSSRKAI